MTATTDRSTQVRDVLAWLERHGTKANRDGLLRYGIVAPKAFGVSMSTMQKLAKQLGQDHALAAALWDTGWYEARTVTAFIGDPARLTAAQMDRWMRGFDNWAICDTLCFALWVQTPHAFAKIRKWASGRDEYVKRASFALLASVALKDKTAPDAQFLRGLTLIEKASTDERNFVKKAVNWALRGIGSRNRALNEAALALARQLASSTGPAPRWIGKDALRQLGSAATQRRLEARSR